MAQPVRRIGRLLEAAGRRGSQDYLMQVGAAEHGVMRALAGAFGEQPPPLPDVDEEKETDPRKDMVMQIVAANE